LKENLNNEIKNEENVKHEINKNNNFSIGIEEKKNGKENEITEENTDQKKNFNLDQIIISEEKDFKKNENKSSDFLKEKNNINNNQIKKDHQKGISIFNRIINSQIRKQIEFYFSDKNYYHDAFLMEKAADDSENCKIINYK